MEIPSGKSFSDQLDSCFVASAAGRTEVDLTLTNVEFGRQEASTESFSLIFRAPSDTPQEQDLFNLTHPALGSVDLLLVPVRRAEDGLYFEAFINRLKSEQSAM